MANHLGLWTYGFFIIGFPFQTRQEIDETTAYAESTGLDYVSYFIAKPYTGSEMWQQFVQEGLLAADHVFSPTGVGEAETHTRYFTKEELQAMVGHAQKRYSHRVLRNYLNPVFFWKYFWPKIKTLDGLQYFGRYVYRVVKLQLLRPRLRILMGSARRGLRAATKTTGN